MSLEKLTLLRSLLISSKEKFDQTDQIINNKNKHMSISTRINANIAENNKIIDSLFQSMIDTNYKILDHIDQKIKLVEQEIDRIPKDNLLPEYHQLLFDDEREINLQINQLKTIKSAKDLMSRSLNEYVDWRYPGIQLNCYAGIPCKSIISCDPLYLVDAKKEHIDEVIKDYPKLFQRRIRKYVIGRKQFNQLPQETFGLAVSWNVLNYFSLANIKIYLESVWPLLRTGGVFAFTYNNCDLLQSAKLSFEYNNMCWATERDIRKIAESIGYVVIKTVDYQMGGSTANYLSWAEIKKPGERTSIKKGSTVGELIEK